jgi:hypothetical protein
MLRTRLMNTLILASFTVAPTLAHAQAAQELDPSIDACLKAWGDHPFGAKPEFKTLNVSVKVFGFGRDTADTEPTSAPSLVLLAPSVNVLGNSRIKLLNPNGWYCLRTNVNVGGGMTLEMHCKANLASAADGKTLKPGEHLQENQSTNVLGSTMIERVGCGS